MHGLAGAANPLLVYFEPFAELERAPARSGWSTPTNKNDDDDSGAAAAGACTRRADEEEARQGVQFVRGVPAASVRLPSCSRI